jgi:hypothetical protein
MKDNKVSWTWKRDFGFWENAIGMYSWDVSSLLIYFNFKVIMSIKSEEGCFIILHYVIIHDWLFQGKKA